MNATVGLSGNMYVKRKKNVQFSMTEVVVVW